MPLSEQLISLTGPLNCPESNAKNTGLSPEAMRAFISLSDDDINELARYRDEKTGKTFLHRLVLSKNIDEGIDKKLFFSKVRDLISAMRGSITPRDRDRLTHYLVRNMDGEQLVVELVSLAKSANVLLLSEATVQNYISEHNQGPKEATDRNMRCQRLGFLQLQIDTSSSSVSTTPSNKITELQREIEILQGQADLTRQALNLRNTIIQRMEQEKTAVSAALSEMTTKLSEMEDALQKANAAIENKKKELETARLANQVLARHSQSQQDKIMTLEAENVSLQEKVRNLETTLSELQQQAQRHASELERTNQRVDAKLSRFNEALKVFQQAITEELPTTPLESMDLGDDIPVAAAPTSRRTPSLAGTRELRSLYSTGDALVEFGLNSTRKRRAQPLNGSSYKTAHTKKQTVAPQYDGETMLDSESDDRLHQPG